jgi:hypothetical protein
VPAAQPEVCPTQAGQQAPPSLKSPEEKVIGLLAATADEGAAEMVNELVVNMAVTVWLPSRFPSAEVTDIPTWTAVAGALASVSVVPSLAVLPWVVPVNAAGPAHTEHVMSWQYVDDDASKSANPAVPAHWFDIGVVPAAALQA